jgi:hypothetical protein
MRIVSTATKFSAIESLSCENGSRRTAGSCTAGCPSHSQGANYGTPLAEVVRPDSTSSSCLLAAVAMLQLAIPVHGRTTPEPVDSVRIDRFSGRSLDPDVKAAQFRRSPSAHDIEA